MHAARRLMFAGIALVATAAQARAQGPLSKWYLTAGDNTTNWIVQGASAAAFGQANNLGNGGEYGIAVNGTIRTMGNGNGNGQPFFGSQYTLGGVYTGTTIPYPGIQASFYDGASDGTNNYSVDYSSGGVYKFGANWSGGVKLFDTGISGLLGITYDPFRNSLWVSQFGGSNIYQYSLMGSVLSSFNSGRSSISSLAMDYADQTLWYGSQSNLGTFWQTDRNGNALQSVTYANMSGQNTLGGEFDVSGFNVSTVPEPSTWALLAVGLVGIAATARRRRA